MLASNFQGNLLSRGICLQHQSTIEKFAQNDHQHHTVPYSNLLYHVNNPQPVSILLVSSGGCKKHSIINMLKKQICHWVQKNATQNNMIQQYLYHGGHIQGHTHMTWTTSHILPIIVDICESKNIKNLGGEFYF